MAKSLTKKDIGTWAIIEPTEQATSAGSLFSKVNSCNLCILGNAAPVNCYSRPFDSYQC